jgi:alpha-beta hydrolase superfamily lysophospholipase
MGTRSVQAYRFQFTSTDGLGIECARWEVQAPVRGIVQIAHGLGEHIGRYVGLIEYLVQAGLVVSGNDHRAAGLFTRAGNNHSADHHCELSRTTILKLADSLGPEDPLRATFLSAPLVRTILDKAEGIGA